MTTPCPGPPPASPPKLTAPPGACDTHIHVFGPFDRFPMSENRSYTPPAATVDALRTFRETLGIERSVVVHPSAYGTDMAVTLDAIARLGASARGIGVVAPDVTDAELEAMDAGGIRGLRFTTLLKGGADVGGIAALANRVAGLGWHIQLYVDGPNQLEDMIPTLRDVPVDVVMDHMGHFSPAAGVDHPGFRALLDFAETGKCWVKLSGPYRVSDTAPGYADMTPFAKALIAARPDRMVWASDWPHVGLHDKPMPHGADLLDWAMTWEVGDATLRRILVDNPAALYGF